jgi:zinc/manganese transport system permease protein
MGTIVSALGVYLSLVMDLPTGATIVCTFGFVLVVMAIIRPLLRQRVGVLIESPNALSAVRNRDR